MTWKVFTGQDNAAIIATAIAETPYPEGVSLRLVDIGRDLPALGDMEIVPGHDTINPAYGAVAEDCSDELTLVAEKDGRIVGQISVDIEMRGGSLTGMDLFVTGVFVDARHRGTGIGSALGGATVRVMEAWRRAQCCSLGRGLNGDIEVTGDTLPDSSGDRVVDMMAGLAMDLSDEAFSIDQVSNAGREHLTATAS